MGVGASFHCRFCELSDWLSSQRRQVRLLRETARDGSSTHQEQVDAALQVRALLSPLFNDGDQVIQFNLKGNRPARLFSNTREYCFIRVTTMENANPGRDFVHRNRLTLQTAVFWATTRV